MKIADLDWMEMLDLLRRWDGLSPAARRAFLGFRQGSGTSPERLGSDAVVDELLRAGLAESPGPRSTLLVVPEQTQRMQVLLRAMDRVRVLDGRGEVLDAYVREHFKAEQTSRLSGEPPPAAGGSSARADDAARVASVDWVRGVLALPDADAARRWELPRRVPGEEASLAVPHTLHALQRLLASLAEHPHGVPFAMLGALLPDVEPTVRAAAVRAGIRYLLLFPALHGEELDAHVGLLPAVARRMGPPPPPPASLQPVETFETPFRLADMTALLVQAATEPIPVRGADGRLYVRSQQAIAARLPHLPGWVADFATLYGNDYADDDYDDPGRSTLPTGAEERIAFASEALASLKLWSVARQGDRYRMLPTRAGTRWLEMDEHRRLREVLTGLRESPQKAPAGWYLQADMVDFFGTRLGFEMRPGATELRAPLARAFLGLPAGAIVSLTDFVLHQSREDNPFLVNGLPQRGSRYGWGIMPTSREDWELAWQQVLIGFVKFRLVPFGGARLGYVGRPEDELLVIGLTDAGRYLLGAVDDFDYAAGAEGEVVVQPDFEIVFLAPAPRLEADLGRFAERTGSGVGALFRITRASVLRAAEQGVTADAVLRTLEGVSRSGVPANVARQVRDWIGGTRRVSIRPAVLIDCPDAETAGRVRTLGGAQVSQITPTVLRLDARGKERAALTRKLREKGIFVQEE